MSAPEDRVDRSGLEFFGALTASATHEIKNALAVIQEVIGLIEDLRARGGGIADCSPERVERLLEKVGVQVRRADGVVRRLNRFAHTADRPGESADLAELAGLLVEMCGRFAAMRKAEIVLRLPAESLPASIDPFRFEQDLYSILRPAIDRAEPGEVVDLELTPGDGALRVTVRCGEGDESPRTLAIPCGEVTHGS